MATTSRSKRSTAQKPARTDSAAAEPTSPVTDPAASTETTDPIARLHMAYWQAINGRDETTGTMTAVDLDHVRQAYLAVPKRNQQRGDAVTKLTAEALKRMAESGDVDPGMVQAIQALSTLFAEANANGGQDPEKPYDPVASVAGMLAALDYARDSILAGLSDEQRDRLADVDPSDPEYQETSADAVTCLAKTGTRALNGRKRKRPERSGKDLGEAIRNSVQRHNGGPVDIGTVARENGLKPSGLWSRHDANKTDGVKAEIREGRRVFIAAA